MNIVDEINLENKNMVVYFSMTLYSILSIDKALRTVKINFVMDFKYNTNDYVRNLGYTLPTTEACARNFKIPWTIPNTVSIERMTESHYFKENFYGCSVYKQGDKILNGPITDSDVIKCESYTMITESTYYTQEMHAPFDTIFVILKIITTGQPGTEYISIMEDVHDTNFQGYRTIGGSYKPLWNDIENNVIVKKVSVEYDEITNVTYPRIYVILPFKHEWKSDVVKYYAIPCVMFVLLIFTEISDHDLISISSSLVLANIALLFTMEKASVITFKEQIVIFQIFYILVSTLILLSPTLNTLVTRIVLGSCNFFMTCLTFGAHYYCSRRASERVRRELDNNDFSSLHTM